MGSSGRYYFTVITVLYFGATILLHNIVSSRDLHQEVACYRDRMRINCGDHSFIAIHEAFFTTRVRDNTTCGPSAIEHEHLKYNDDDEDAELESTTSTDPTEVSSGCYEDIRVSINQKCSGARSCNYSYHEQVEKKCPNMRGQYVVGYDCVRNSSVVKYCNTKLASREGYFSSPGFPRFYPQLSQCGWTISSLEGQIILLKILHLHLRPPTEVVPTQSDLDSLYALGILSQMVSEEDVKCDVDSLTIIEGNVKRASVCGQSLSGLKVFEIQSGNVEINFRSVDFYPASGFLMYYKILDEVATSKMFVENESIEFQQSENSTLPNAERTTAEAKKAAYLEDILIPSILIGVLLLVNSIIVAIIIISRRRQKGKLVLEEENFEDPKSEPLVADAKDI